MEFHIARKLVQKMENIIRRYNTGTVLERKFYNSKNTVERKKSSQSVLEMGRYGSCNKDKTWEKAKKIFRK